MRLCRFDANSLGLVEGADIVDVTEVLEHLPAERYPFPRHDQLIAELPRLRPLIERAADGGRRIPVSEARLLSPVANPNKIVAAPVNYRRHLDEARNDGGINFGHPIPEIRQLGLFLKATSSVVGACEGVTISHPDRRTDHEVELAVVIGRRARDVAPERALEHVAGYCIGLDMTVRGAEDKSFRKSPDSFTVLGPWLVTGDAFVAPGDRTLGLDVQGVSRQRASTRDLVVGIPELIAWASSFYTLWPGDVLLTGTPEGVGPVAPGDCMHAFIDGIGAMDVHVHAPPRHDLRHGDDA